MLAKTNRVIRPSDFRSAVRRGRRVSAGCAVVHVLDRNDDRPVRFGFIVTKAVGGAVVRNKVRRRLRGVCRDILPSVKPGTDVVVRALPGSAEVPWDILQSQMERALLGNGMTR